MNIKFLKRLVIIASLLLGTSAFILGDKPKPSDDALGISFNEFDTLIQQPVNSIAPIELAKLLQEQNAHYQLVKLDEPDSYQIPTSAQLTVNQLVKQGWLLNEHIILYAEDTNLALQGYYLLLIRGYFKVRLVTGGLPQWRQQVLFPAKATIPLQQLEFRQQLAKFFGGQLVDTYSGTDQQHPLKAIRLDKKQHRRQGC